MPLPGLRTAALLAALVPALVLPVAAAPASAADPGGLVERATDPALRGITLRAGADPVRVQADLRSAPAAASATTVERAGPASTFIVRFVDTTGPGARTWTEPARTAFLAGVDVWARTVESTVPIEVTATARRLPFGALGSAGPTSFLRDQAGTPTPALDGSEQTRRTLADDVFEPVALANAKAGRDLVPGEADIEAEVDPSDPTLHLGVDSGPSPDQFDFRTVVVHELAHGLGLIGTGDVRVDGTAVLGLQDVNGATGVRAPVSFDTFAYATSVAEAGTGGRRVTELPDGSPELLAALTGDRLYWSGQLARTAAGGARIRLFAPSQCDALDRPRRCSAQESPFLGGSSFGHLDEKAYPTGTSDALLTPQVDPGESIREPGQIALGMLSDLGYAVPALRGSRYTALDPVRLLDTRESGARLPAGAVIDLQVAGRLGVPADATAVVLNLTGVGPTTATDLRVYPTPVTPGPVPTVSNLNLAAGTTRANLVTVPVGVDGRVRVRNQAGSVAVVADLAGFYGPSAEAGFSPVDPVRLLDTREGTGTRIGPGGTVDLEVAGVPTGATAVVLTLTAVGATAPTDVRAYPVAAGLPGPPRVSSLNVGDAAAVPNLVVVRLGPDGRVRLRNQAGAVHLLADLAGWYSPAGTGLFRPVTPARVLDTRTGLGAPAGRVPAGGSVSLLVGGVARVSGTATAAVLNVTGVQASRATDVRVFPATAAAVPRTSNLNLGPGQTAADLVVARLGDRRARLYTSAGDVALVGDVAGWFGP